MAAEYLARMGERIKARREELKLTQQQVANRLPGEVSNARVSLWERGKNRPRDDYLEKLAEILEVDVAYFMAAEPQKETTPSPFAPAERHEDGDQKLNETNAKLDAALERLTQILDLNTRVLGELAAGQALIIRLLGGAGGGEALAVEQPGDPEFPDVRQTPDTDERAGEG